MQTTQKKSVVKKVVKVTPTKKAKASAKAKTSVKKDETDPLASAVKKVSEKDVQEAYNEAVANKKVAVKLPKPIVLVEPTEPIVEIEPTEPAEPEYTLTPVQANVSQLDAASQKEVKQILEDNKLDWDVRKEDLIAVSTFAPNGSEGIHLPTPNSGIYRNDNNTHLGTTSKKYTCYQNSELVECIYEASKAVNLEITNGGWCYEGSRVFLDLKLEDVYVGNSKIKRSITCLNAHNGRGSVQFGATYTIISKTATGTKANKFTRIFGDNGKFYHYANVSSRVKSAISGLFESLAKENATIETMLAMTKVKVDEKLLHEIVKKCFRVDLNNTTGNVATRTLNNITAVSQVMTQQINNEEGTLWGLFNGILATTANRTPKNQSEEDYVKAGRGNLVNMKAFDIISNYLNSRK